MTTDEYDKFKTELEKRGYKRYPSINSADFAYFKSFGKSDHVGGRSNYQICFDVYDYSKYADKYLDIISRAYGVMPSALVSRTADERLDLTIKLIDEATEIDEIEQLAESFFQWVEKEMKI